jgi:hypothetical protein
LPIFNRTGKLPHRFPKIKDFGEVLDRPAIDRAARMQTNIARAGRRVSLHLQGQHDIRAV